MGCAGPRLYLRMEVTGEGLVLGARTILAKMVRDERGAPFLFLEDEQRTIALLTTAYQRPFEPYLLAKLSRACELWNDGEKALAHIYLAHASLPQCDEERALRLFVAEELLDSETTPHTLLKAQGFDPAALDLSKFSPAQLRVPAGSGRESGHWTSDVPEESPK